MNILPKKSWHVRNRDNIAKVKRDEAQAAEEEKKKQDRIALAEQEARTEQLRIKARNKYGSNAEPLPQAEPRVTSAQPPSEGVQPVPHGHINFFSELEAGSKVSGANKDHEAEKKQEQEEYEKKIGLLTYLGQSSAELQAVKPWYQQARKGKGEKTELKDSEKNDLKRKASLDPMNDMLRYLGKKPRDSAGAKTSKQKEDLHPNTKLAATGGLPGTSSLLSMFSKYRNKSAENDLEKPSTDNRKRRKKKKEKENHKRAKSERDSRAHRRKKSHKREKQRRKRNHREDTDSDSENEVGGARRHRKSHRRKGSKRAKSRGKRRRDSHSCDEDSRNGSDSSASESDSAGSGSRSPSPRESRRGPTIEELRAERLRREAAERAKTERLLSGKPLEDKVSTEPRVTDKLDGKYNSQFNPHLARKHQPKQPLF